MTKNSGLLIQVAIIGLLLVCALLYLHGFRGVLPYYDDPDEPHFYLAATEIRISGSVHINPLYPPLRSYQMAGEQWLIDVITRGQASNTVYGIFARAGSAFAALVLLSLLYQIGTKLHSPIAGLFVVVLVALDGQLVSFSHVARGDTWSWAFTAGVILATIGLLRAERKSLWVLIGICSLGAFLSKYSAAPIWLLPAYLLLRRVFPKPVVQLAIVTTGLVLAAGLWGWIRVDSEAWTNTLTRTGFSFLIAKDFSFIETFWQSIHNFRTGLSDAKLITGFLFVPAVFLWRPRPNFKARLTILSLLMAVILGTSLVFSLTVARYHDAYTVVIIWAILGGWSLAILSQRFGKATLVIALIWMATINWPLAQEAWRFGDERIAPNSLAALGDWFIDHVPQGARVVVERSTPFNSYAGFPGRHIFHSRTVNTLLKEELSAYQQRGYEYAVWSSKGFHDSGLSDPATLANLPYFENATELIRWMPPEYRGPGLVVFQIPPIQQHPLYAWFTSAISFRGYDLNQNSFKPGDEVDLTLYWESADVIPNNYIIFVHILDLRTGYLVAGQDGPPDNGLTPTWKWLGDMQFIRDRRTLSIPADAKPGTYTLRIGMYDADTKARVIVLDLKNQPIGDTLVLQEVNVEN